MGARKLSYYNEETNFLNSFSKKEVTKFFHNPKKSTLDYFTFGMLLPNRHEDAGEYRYGFQGQEKDDEIDGVEGSHLDFGARIYNSRIGRWLSRDPLEMKSPEYSPYKAMKNNPIVYIDPDGKDEIVRITIYDYDKNETRVFEFYIDNNMVLWDGEVNAATIIDQALVIYRNDYYNYTSNYTVYIKNGVPTATFNGREIIKSDNPIDSDYSTSSGSSGPVKDVFQGLEGDGGKQKNGWRLISKTNGASPTKQKSDYVEKSIEIDGLLALLGISSGKPQNIYDKACDISDGIDHASEALDQAIQTEDEPEDNTGITKESVGTGTTGGGLNTGKSIEVDEKDSVFVIIKWDNGSTDSGYQKNLETNKDTIIIE
jgi:RHS repeat-associated protein